MATTSSPPAAAAPHPCPAPTALEQTIKELEQKSRDQDLSDAKVKLAALTKINGDVSQIEAKYKQDYESLKFQEAQSAGYQEKRLEQVEDKVNQAQRDTIDTIVDCADERIEDLEKKWKDIRATLGQKQLTLATATIELFEADEDYKEHANYKDNQKKLDTLQADVTKTIEAQNFLGAYFLVSDMGERLIEPKPPKDFNQALEAAALRLYEKTDVQRRAKTDLDLATAESQKAKKAYEDAQTKRQENVLKQIGDAGLDLADPPPAPGTPGGPATSGTSAQEAPNASAAPPTTQQTGASGKGTIGQQGSGSSGSGGASGTGG
jgi:hypothetical protein